MDRPIKYNKQGKYNLKFIDPVNDISAIYSDKNYINNTKFPIPQFTFQEFQQLLVQHSNQNTFLTPMTMTPNLLNQLKKVKITKQQKSCSICVKDYKLGQKIIKTNCEHYFHQQCLGPWIQNGNNSCPNCRQAMFKQYELEQQL